MYLPQAPHENVISGLLWVRSCIIKLYDFENLRWQYLQMNSHFGRILRRKSDRQSLLSIRITANIVPELDDRFVWISLIEVEWNRTPNLQRAKSYKFIHGIRESERSAQNKTDISSFIRTNAPIRCKTSSRRRLIRFVGKDKINTNQKPNLHYTAKRKWIIFGISFMEYDGKNRSG